MQSVRGSAMEDVIFAGSQDRPSRNMAEVTLFIDNSKRTAPAEFNDADILEVTRRIEREAGSAYKVNGKDARARDVRLLFEDAATGARSPALVRQGRIGEIVNAPPQERRRVLEDAAGIAGLHSRRHEAELRLKATEANLARLADLIDLMSSQLQALRRQGVRRSAIARSRARSARPRRSSITSIGRLHARWSSTRKPRSNTRSAQWRKRPRPRARRSASRPRPPRSFNRCATRRLRAPPCCIA
jgi:chromosome segregation protein